MDATLLKRLGSLVRKRGLTGAQLSSALGYSRCWWTDRLRAGTIREADVRAVADHLGLDYPLLVLETYGTPGLHRPVEPAPAWVERAFSRIANEAIGQATQLSVTLIDITHTNPVGALDQAIHAIETEPPAELPALLSVAGYAASRLMRADAYAIHFSAVQAAHRLEMNAGEALHHMSAHFGLIGEYKIALHCCSLAHDAHIYAADPTGAAKVGAHRAVWHYYLGDYITARRWATLALDALPDVLTHYQIAVRQIQALIALAEGEEIEALQAYRKVDHFARQLAGIHDAKAWWLGGAIAATFKRYPDAVHLLACAVDRFLTSQIPGDLGDAALCACDLIEVQLCQGTIAVAAQTAEKLIPLLESLHNYRQVAEAIRILLTARHAALTIDHVGQARQYLQRARPTMPNFSRQE